MKPDAETQEFLDEIAAADAKPWTEMTPAEARESWYTVVQLFSGEPEPVAAIDDHLVEGPAGIIEMRSYTPEGSGPFPTLVYLHGGGWVVGTIDTYQVATRALANASGCKVFVPRYRMAPEHEYPAAVEDCYAAVSWLADHAGDLDVDATRLAVGGDSAGGNLAAAVTLMARDKGAPPIAFQLLIYPVTDHRTDTPCYKEFATDHYLEAAAMEWFWAHYLPSTAAGEEPYASPLRADDLSGLPPAHIISAGCDVLRDEAEAYGARLAEAGVEVTVSRYDGTIHGFMHPLSGRLSRGKEGIADAGGAVRAALA